METWGGYLLMLLKSFKEQLMDIQQYIAADKALLLNLNGSDSLFWDGFMWIATSTIVWVPVAVILLYIIIKNNKIQEACLIVVMIALVITLADQIASGFCKPFFSRFRPTQDSDIMYMVDIVNGYRGGRFGFISSHAANTFAVTVFLSLLIKRKSLTLMLVFWAVLNSYSRIYLGVHYPGDILFGTLEGGIIGYLVYLLYKLIQNKFFYKPRCISNQYTASGYLISDINLLYAVLFSTYFFIIIAGIIVIQTLNL